MGLDQSDLTLHRHHRCHFHLFSVLLLLPGILLLHTHNKDRRHAPSRKSGGRYWQNVVEGAQRRFLHRPATTSSCSISGIIATSLFVETPGKSGRTCPANRALIGSRRNSPCPAAPAPVAHDRDASATFKNDPSERARRRAPGR